MLPQALHRRIPRFKKGLAKILDRARRVKHQL